MRISYLSLFTALTLVACGGKTTPTTVPAPDADTLATDLSNDSAPADIDGYNEDEDDMGDDYMGHSMQMWSEYRQNMEPLLPEANGKAQKIKECAYLDIDGDGTLECIAHTDNYQTAVFTHGNDDGIAIDQCQLVACFDGIGLHLIPAGHAVVTYEGVSIGYERENIYIIDKSKVSTVYSFSADPKGGGNVAFAYQRFDKATGQTTTLQEDDYEAIKKQIGDEWYSEDSLEWWDY